MAKDQELLIKINGSAKQFNDEIDRVNKKTKSLQENLGKVAKVSTVAFVGLAGAVGTTVVRFAQFEKTFTNVQTLLDKSSFSTKTLTKGVEDLRKGVIALGAKSGESFENLNEGLFNLISGGVKADDAMEALGVATKLATAGATDTNTAVKALTATFTSFGDEAGTAQEVAEKFFTAQKFGVTTVGELAKEFNKVAGISKNLGLSFDETLASLSSLTADGAKPTAEAATQLKAAFNSIILVQSKLKNESTAVRDALDLQNVRQRGLVESLNLLKQATGGNISEMQRLVGSSESLSVLLSLTGGQSELVAKQVDAMADASARAATFQEALATKQATTEQSMKRLTAAVDGVAVTFGSAFAPTINLAADALSAIAVRVSEFDDDTIELIATVTAIVTGLTGLIAILAGTALGYLKLKAVVIGLNTTLGISTGIMRAYNFTLVAGRKILTLFRLGMVAATTTVRGFAAATGIGLLIVALSLAITNFKEFKAIVAGTMAASGVLIRDFVSGAAKLFGSLGQLIVGALTFDTGKIESGLNNLKATLASGFSETGTASADAFKTAFDASIAETEASERADAGQTDSPSAAGSEDPSVAAEKAKAVEDARQEAILESQIEGAEKRRELEEKEAELKAEKVIEQDAADIERILATEQTKDDIMKDIAKDRLKRNIKNKNQFLKDEIEHGTAIAKFNQFMRDEDVKGTLETNNQLVRLTNSKNSTLKGIGKAASLVQIGIKTAEGAISAYASLSGIPIVGPALGAAAAGALIAFGAEQASNVISAQGGGIVPNGAGGMRDRVPAFVEPGELIVPRAIAPDFIQSVGRPDVGDEESAGGATQEVVVGFRDEAFEIIEQKLLERRATGSGGL